MSGTERIAASDLVPMDLFEGAENLRIDLVYAGAGHPENIFKTDIYGCGARLSLHRGLARIVLLTARSLYRDHGWTLILKDGLRTVEAQARMMETNIVRQNPQWLQDPPMLSRPGQRAHPRGMAVDAAAIDAAGNAVDMGTVFDDMTPRAARDYEGFDAPVLENRKKLETAFMASAGKLGLALLPLPCEWWDFRVPASEHGRYAPLSEGDLPSPLRMISPAPDPVFEESLERLAKSILLSL